MEQLIDLVVQRMGLPCNQAQQAVHVVPAPRTQSVVGERMSLCAPYLV